MTHPPFRKDSTQAGVDHPSHPGDTPGLRARKQQYDAARINKADIIARHDTLDPGFPPTVKGILHELDIPGATEEQSSFDETVRQVKVAKNALSRQGAESARREARNTEKKKAKQAQTRPTMGPLPHRKP